MYFKKRNNENNKRFLASYKNKDLELYLTFVERYRLYFLAKYILSL